MGSDGISCSNGSSSRADSNTPVTNGARSTLVASMRPPMPTSRMTTSGRVREKMCRPVCFRGCGGAEAVCSQVRVQGQKVLVSYDGGMKWVRQRPTPSNVKNLKYPGMPTSSVDASRSML